MLIKFKRFMMKLQLLRNATQILTVNGKTILIDPMLAPKHSYASFGQTSNDQKNPLVDLPIDHTALEMLIAQTDAILLTHIHLDHWDITAHQLLPKDILIFCQPEDIQAIEHAGFTNLRPIASELIWSHISIQRTGGRHGTGDTGKRMGTVSGYFIQFQEESVYLAGDTIWCQEVRTAIDHFHPTRIVLNGGAARFLTGDPIVMDINDIIQVCYYAPEAAVYVVHLEAVNHSSESREKIRQAVKKHDLSKRCTAPDDGKYIF